MGVFQKLAGKRLGYMLGYTLRYQAFRNHRVRRFQSSPSMQVSGITEYAGIMYIYMYMYINIYIYIKLRGRPPLGYDFQAQVRGPLSHFFVYGPLSQHWSRFLIDFGLSGFPRETYLKPWTAVLPSRWIILEGFGRFLEVLRCPGVPKGAIWKK